jgi:hypothetical protein
MPQAVDLTSRRFTRLLVLGLAPKRPRNTNRRWHVLCDCGTARTVFGMDLLAGRTKSCGCLSRDNARTNMHAVRHGEAKRKDRAPSPEYVAWGSMIQRCYDINSKGYAAYGRRGITVCTRWRNSFPAFLADMGRRPSRAHSLDRIDNERGYAPANCRWATREVQGRNTRTNRLIRYKRRTMCLAAWAEEVGMHRATLARRLDRGWSVHKAITTPVRCRRS